MEEELTKVYNPQPRDFASFGYAQNVTNSITSMEIEQEDDPDRHQRVGDPMFDDMLIDEAEKPVPAATEEVFSMQRETKKK